MKRIKAARLLPRPVKSFLYNRARPARHQRELASCQTLREAGAELDLAPDVRVARRYLGRGDGEWCVHPGTLRPGSVAFCFGVGRDISFDLDLVRRLRMRVFAFDPTPIAQAWITPQLPKLPPGFRFVPTGIANYDGRATFQLPAAHGTSFSMKEVSDPSRTATGEVARLTTLMQRLDITRIDLMKIDIEGAEYDLTEDLCHHADRIGQLLIEFHHRFAPDPAAGMARTRAMIDALRDAGFQLFNTSPRGLEFSLIHRDAGPATA